MKNNILSLVLVCLSLLSIGQEPGEYDGIDAIKEIREGWLIVRLPGFEKKIAALDSILTTGSLSSKARHQLQQTLAQALADRDFIHKWYPLAFDREYKFSRHAFIYTHESTDFLNGHLAARDANGQPVFFAADSKFIIGTLDGVAGDPFRFTTSTHQKVSSPLPDYITMPGIMIPALDRELPQEIVETNYRRSEVYRVYRHARRISRKLNAIYDKWY